MTQSSPWPLMRYFLLAGEKAGSYTQAADKYRGDVIPETRVRVQTGGHGGLTPLKVPSLVSLVGSDHVLVLFSPRKLQCPGL